MKMLKPGLKIKFILITSLAIVVFMAILGYMAVKRESDILYREVEKQGRLLGEILAIPIVNDLIYERLGLVEEGGLRDNYIMEIFNRRDADIIYLAILDESGRVISHSSVEEYGKTYSDAMTRTMLESEIPVVQKTFGKTKEAVEFGTPLSIGKKRWGTLRLAISLEKVKSEILLTVKKIIALTGFFLAGGFVIILFLSNRFINPITELAGTMERADVDYLDAKAEVKGHDELAVLGEKFNSMMERIRQSSAELKRTNEKLIQSEKLASIGILASGVAHEINNPLGGLFNCIRMLRQKGGDPELRLKYLELAKEGLEKIENTVNRLLWMSKKSEHAPVEVNIRNVVESVYALMEYKLKKSRIDFKNEMPADIRFYFDMHDFQQLLINLFINAIHAMSGGGDLTVKGKSDGARLLIEVRDNGCGISRENLGRIFDPFFTTKAQGEGTGLGLWLSYEIVRNYNGTINVESEEGKGSNFILSFPVQ